MTFTITVDDIYHLTFDVFDFSIKERPMTKINRTTPTVLGWLIKDDEGNYILLNAEYVENPLKELNNTVVVQEAYKATKILLLQYSASSNSTADEASLKHFAWALMRELRDKVIPASKIDGNVQ